MGGPYGDAGAIDLATRRRGRRGPHPRGFTLLELLITLSITTIGLIGLLALHLSITRGNDGASRAAEAEQITVTDLESLRSMSASKMNAWIGAHATDTKLGRNNLPYKLARSVTQISPSLLRVRVQTTWTEDGAAFRTTVNPGAPLNHAFALEVIRTVEEGL